MRAVEPGPPVRVTYALSEGGRALEPAIAALASWASGGSPAGAAEDQRLAGPAR